MMCSVLAVQCVRAALPQTVERDAHNLLADKTNSLCNDKASSQEIVMASLLRRHAKGIRLGPMGMGRGGSECIPKMNANSSQGTNQALST